MKTAFAASTVLLLAGSSYGFTFIAATIEPNGSISPSSGNFVNYYSGYYLGPGSVVTDARNSWKNYFNTVVTTTWLGADPAGGGAITDAYNNPFSRELTGPGANPFAPLVSGSNANWFGEGLAPDGSVINAGPSGATWGPGSSLGFAMESEVSDVNGTAVDSVMIANFVLTDPNATLTGSDILVNIEGTLYALPLDGSKGSGGFGLEYEVDQVATGKRMRAFVVVPTPGSVGLLGIAGLAAVRRRR